MSGSFEKSVKGATKIKVRATGMRLQRLRLPSPRRTSWCPNSADRSRSYPQNAPPKTKYIEHILIATHSGDAGVGEVFRSLQYRLHDSTWTVVLKSLLTTHLMIREGSPNVTLAFLSKHRSVFSVGHFADGLSIQRRDSRHFQQKLTAFYQLKLRVETFAIMQITCQNERAHTATRRRIGFEPTKQSWRD